MTVTLKTHVFSALTPQNIADLCARSAVFRPEVLTAVERIDRQVRKDGDAALKRLSREFDQAEVAELRVGAGAFEKAWRDCPPALKAAIDQAAQNIRAFHRPQAQGDYRTSVRPGVACWREFRPIPVVGLYVPGGSAPLISTLLMTAIPAQLAGCRRIIVCTPPEPGDAILAAAYRLGIDEIYRLGGAQAIFAMAYGTQTVPKADKIFGPGNAYVAAAKLKVSACCATDMVAGPSEAMVYADDEADPAWVAADLLSQAEHGADSQVVLLAHGRTQISAVQGELTRQLAALPRRAIAAACLDKSFAICCADTGEALSFINAYAPEHLILNCRNWCRIAAGVINAGSVFCGAHAPESAGDYASGTNHTLPTSGFARSTGGLSVENFGKYVTFQHLDKEGLRDLAPAIDALAHAEGLEAHARAVELRLRR